MAFDALGASTASAERAAQIIWPTALYGLTIFVLMRASRRYAGADVAMPSLILSTAALFCLVIYSPGVIDHHNVQLLLTAAGLWPLMEAPSWRPAALLSGICAGLTLTVGMETAPMWRRSASARRSCSSSTIRSAPPREASALDLPASP
ncbi:hypothetical protein ACVOMV_03060 [Mesorhizobium atlanticum]